MTFLALRFSHYVNGVAMRHSEVSQDMFPRYPIRAITNGVHATTWTAPSFQKVYDSHMPGWRRDNVYLRYAIKIPLGEIQQAHAQAKLNLIEAAKAKTGLRLDPDVLTIGFARRAALYKRADLVLADMERLTRMARNIGRIQLLFAGKAHPRDEGGKTLIRKIFEGNTKETGQNLRIAYLENHDMAWAQLLTSGVDLWLNTPQKP